MLGVTAEYAGKLPRASGFIVASATLLTDGEFLGPIGFDVYVAAGIVLGLAYAWWGWALFRTSRADAMSEANTADS